MSFAKKLILPLLFVAFALVFGACSSLKKVAYVQNSEYLNPEASRMLYDARIMPKDLLTITVNTSEQDASQPFNLTYPTGGKNGGGGGYGAGSFISYLVDNEGNIEFPKVGKVHLVGLTKSEAEAVIRNKISPYMSEQEKPIVTVRMANYKISVLGEVGSPGVYTVSNEKINLLEALAQAGDLTIYGKRDNIKLIREDEFGEKTFHELNINDANIVNSPYYYLQQNDIIYVEPNKVKAQNSIIGSSTTLWFSVTSFVVTLATLVINIAK